MLQVWNMAKEMKVANDEEDEKEQKKEMDLDSTIMGE